VPHSTITLLTLPEIGRLLGIAHVSAWRHARRGYYGNPSLLVGSSVVRYSVDAIEEGLGRTFRPDEIEAAATTLNKSVRELRDLDRALARKRLPNPETLRKIFHP